MQKMKMQGSNGAIYEGSPIDIDIEHAMRATNASTIESACCLLEIAIAAGALSLLVCYNQYRPGKVKYRDSCPCPEAFEVTVLFCFVSTGAAEECLLRVPARGHQAPPPVRDPFCRG
jgi:hypothetical protein